MIKDKRDGVTLKPWNGHHRYRWRVFWPESNKRKTKGFVKKSGAGGAEEFFEKQRKRVKAQGSEDAQFSKSERLAVMTFRQKAEELLEVGEKVSLEDVVREWGERQNVSLKRQTISDLIKKYSSYLDVKAKKKNATPLSELYKQTVRNRLATFDQKYGDWMASAFNEEIIKDWLDNLRTITKRPTGAGSRGKLASRSKKGPLLSPRSRNHYRDALHGLFEYAKDEKSVADNPVAKIKKVAVPESNIGVLSLRQAADLLAACDPEFAPVVALGLFAGLRVTELERTEWEDIDLEERGTGEIVVPYLATTKAQDTREIPISPNLRFWLEPFADRTGLLVKSHAVYRRKIERARRVAGICVWPKNALRHSFASYHYAMYKDKLLVKQLMGHQTKSDTLEQHYRRRLPLKDAESFWSITPLAKGKSKA
tara:strand:- start:134 stop:1405 length:1272 start_codon:yes stop_codon:yes gene_type:complete